MKNIINRTNEEFKELYVIIKVGEEIEGNFIEDEEKRIWLTTSEEKQAWKILNILEKNFKHYGFQMNIYECTNIEFDKKRG